MRNRLATRITLPRWALWAFLGLSAAAIVVTAARNWTQLHTAIPGPDVESPAIPELVSPADGRAVAPPVLLRWVLPLGPGPVEVQVVAPSGRSALTQTCLVDSLELTRAVLRERGQYLWRVVPPGLPPHSCPTRSFVVGRRGD
jgi:hypothetical protein